MKVMLTLYKNQKESLYRREKEIIGGTYVLGASFSFGTVANKATGCLNAGLIVAKGAGGPWVQAWVAAGNLAAPNGSLGLSTW